MTIEETTQHFSRSIEVFFPVSIRDKGIEKTYFEHLRTEVHLVFDTWRETALDESIFKMIIRHDHDGICERRTTSYKTLPESPETFRVCRPHWADHFSIYERRSDMITAATKINTRSCEFAATGVFQEYLSVPDSETKMLEVTYILKARPSLNWIRYIRGS